MKVVALSDTHGEHRYVGRKPVPKLPGGDVLVHAGDFSGHGTEEDAVAFADWMAEQPHTFKVVVAGNHDWFAQREPNACSTLFGSRGLYYLNETGLTLEGVKFWGSPWTNQFFNWAFMDYEEELTKRWEKMPLDTDVLVTHSPPYGVLDKSSHTKRVGCKSLADRVALVQPKLHVFGHIHEGRDRRHTPGGIEVHPPTTYANVSFLDSSYWPYAYEQPVFDVEPS